MNYWTVISGVDWVGSKQTDVDWLDWLVLDVNWLVLELWLDCWTFPPCAPTLRIVPEGSVATTVKQNTTLTTVTVTVNGNDVHTWLVLLCSFVCLAGALAAFLNFWVFLSMTLAWRNCKHILLQSQDRKVRRDLPLRFFFAGCPSTFLVDITGTLSASSEKDVNFPSKKQVSRFWGLPSDLHKHCKDPSRL